MLRISSPCIRTSESFTDFPVRMENIQEPPDATNPTTYSVQSQNETTNCTRNEHTSSQTNKHKTASYLHNRIEWQQRGIPHEHNVLATIATNNETLERQSSNNHIFSNTSQQQQLTTIPTLTSLNQNEQSRAIRR